MGQKSNLLTIRKKKSLSLINLQYKNVFYPLFFLKYLKQLFDKKKIFVSNSSFSILGNQIFLTVDLFFRTVKINKFKRNIVFLKQKLVKNLIISRLYHKILSFLKANLLIISIKNLNTFSNKQLFLKLFYKFKKFHITLFPRRFNFFIDFIKISVLFLYSKVNLNFYLEVLGQIFKILPKRRHNLFFTFLKQYFEILIYNIEINEKMSLKGIKFMISGRIMAKSRAKFKYFQIGKIPLQSIDSNIDFSKLHVYTFYGVFGLKLWTHRV